MRSNAKTHIKQVHIDKIHYCTQTNCNSGPFNKYTLKTHLATVHSIGEVATVNCKFCDKEYANKEKVGKCPCEGKQNDLKKKRAKFRKKQMAERKIVKKSQKSKPRKNK